MVWLGKLADPWAEERMLCDVWFQDGLTDDDRDWLRHHLELIGKEPPDRDIRWIKFEAIR